jgi:hypothetical protein
VKILIGYFREHPNIVQFLYEELIYVTDLSHFLRRDLPFHHREASPPKKNKKKQMAFFRFFFPKNPEAAQPFFFVFFWGGSFPMMKW